MFRDRRQERREERRGGGGADHYRMRQKLVSIGDDYWIENDAMVKKAVITPVRDRWTVAVADGPDLEVKGNILDHEYTIEDGRAKAAEVSKKWFRVADTYGVEVAPGQDPVVILAVTAVLDTMAHPDR